VYKTYLFKDKDPVIDLLRTAVQFESDAKGIKFGTVLKRLSNDSGVSVGTLYSWFGGVTRQPRYSSVAAIASALRIQFRIGERSTKLRAIKGGRG